VVSGSTDLGRPRFSAGDSNDTVWKKTLAALKEQGGGMPLEIVKAVALKFLGGYLGVSLRGIER
jgi:hypothetical protein